MVSDDQIIYECRKGKRRAYSQLYQKYAPVLLGICIRYTHKREEAEDVLQEGFIKVFQKINTFEGKGSFEGWLKRIMVNTAINYYKSNKKYQLQEEYDVNNVNHTKSNQPDEIVELDGPINQEVLIGMINDLPVGYRLVFNMYVFDGMTHKEIALDLNVSEGTSKSQLSKARRHLKAKVEELQQKLIKV